MTSTKVASSPAPGDVDGLDGEFAAGLPFERGVVGTGERGQESGPVRCRVGADTVECGLDHELGVIVAHQHSCPFVEAERGLDEEVGVIELLGESGGSDQGATSVGMCGATLGGPEGGEKVSALVLVR